MQPDLETRIESNMETWKSAIMAMCAEEAACDVRQKRDRLLSSCDYTTATDYPASEIERTAWIEYRQKLRDIPEQEGFPFDVIWPERPMRDKASETILSAIDSRQGIVENAVTALAGEPIESEV